MLVPGDEALMSTGEQLQYVRRVDTLNQSADFFIPSANSLYPVLKKKMSLWLDVFFALGRMGLPPLTGDSELLLQGPQHIYLGEVST